MFTPQDLVSAMQNKGQDLLELSGLYYLAADLLGNHAQVSVERVCLSFYERQLRPPLSQEDEADAFFFVLYESMSRADRAFAHYVNESDFRRELTALHCELFGVALTSRLGWHRERQCLRELICTRQYLIEMGEVPLWEAMGGYNRAVADAGFGLVRDARDRGRRLMSARESLLKRSQAHGGLPLECVVRYTNRYDADLVWRSGYGVLALLQALEEQLDFRMSGEAQLRLQSLLRVLYEKAWSQLTSVRLL